MITVVQDYDRWAKLARFSGFDEWPEPDNIKHIWTGKEGKQYGEWDGDANFGVVCSTAEEFEEWLVEGDLPEGYIYEFLLENGCVRLFSKEPV